jgi:hypothetical protein
MEELQRILESDTTTAKPAAASEASPATPTPAQPPLDERLREVLQEGEGGAAPPAAPAPSELREVEQPVFEEPPRKGWIGRMKDKLFKDGEEGELNLDEGGTPETAPDAVSPIYRYTPDGTPPSGEGD